MIIHIFIFIFFINSLIIYHLKIANNILNLQPISAKLNIFKANSFKTLKSTYIQQGIKVSIQFDFIWFMSVANKICICLCCSECACWMSACYDEWSSTQACGLGTLSCVGCCWSLFAPIPHKFECGDCDKATDQLKKGAKLCVYGWVLSCVGPVDGCINCVLYLKKNFQSGVSGSSDMLQNCQFLGKKVANALDVSGSNEPGNTFKSYSP